MEKGFTLSDLFANLDGESYGSRSEMEEAVVGVTNQNTFNLPVGFSYKDAVDGALQQGWFKLNPDGTPGVRIDLGTE